MGLEFYVDLHVGVDETISVRSGDSIAHQVKDAIRQPVPALPMSSSTSSRRRRSKAVLADWWNRHPLRRPVSCRSRRETGVNLPSGCDRSRKTVSKVRTDPGRDCAESAAPSQNRLGSLVEQASVASAGFLPFAARNRVSLPSGCDRSRQTVSKVRTDPGRDHSGTRGFLTLPACADPHHSRTEPAQVSPPPKTTIST